MNLFSGKAFAIAVPNGSRGGGSNNINGASFDCRGFRNLGAIVEWGAIAATANTSLHWQGSDDGTTWQNLAGTKVAVGAGDDNLLTMIGLERPLHRYNRLVVVRNTANAALRTAIYMAGFARDTDVDQSSDVDEVVWFESPPAGTP